jgi:pantetheine-phosphate adenylyltransferase
VSSPRRAAPRRADHAVLGGTFDRFHVGHEALLAAAFRAGRRVSIGVTTAEFLAEHPKPFGRAIQPFSSRTAALRRFLRRTYPRRTWALRPLGDAFGRSLDPGVGVLVVSEETERGGRAVNVERRRRGLRAVPIVVVPTVLADDLEPVSSRRIRAGTIDRRGRRLARIAVGLATADATARGPARRAILDAFPTAVVTERRVPRPGQAGAGARAADLAGLAARGRDLGVGLGARTAGGWTVSLRNHDRLRGPRRVRGSSPAELSRNLLEALRAGESKRR